MNLLILNQLGTPQSPNPKDVGIYLDEFLMDKNIIGLPYVLRWVLVKIGIVPRRKYSSAEKYKKSWTANGSPLAINTFLLEKAVKENLNSDWKVVTGMRYGEPSLQSVLSKLDLNDFNRIVFLPLYPQFAQATVGSSVENFLDILYKLNFKDISKFEIVSPFYKQKWYIDSQSNLIKLHLKDQHHLLFSFHGIPLSQEKKSKISYHQQCLETSDRIAKELGFNEKQFSVGFQSRVGVTKWLEPSTEYMTQKLAMSGVTKLQVVCPSFVADCLETIEEIGMELKETFLKHGGQEFALIPCLNDSSEFAKGIASHILTNKLSV